MRYFNKVRRLALAVSFFAATLGTAHATLPGSNGVIIYETNQGAIMKVAPDGGTPQQIGAGSHPTVSPDGMQVAFAINMVNGVYTGQLWVMNIDGTNLRLLGQSRKEGGLPPFAYNPFIDGIAWSPDGTQIAYADVSSNYFQVFVCNVSTGCPPDADYSPTAGIWRKDNGSWQRLNWSTAGLIGSTNYDNHVIDPTGKVDAVKYPYLGWASWLPGSKVLSGSSAENNCASTMNVNGTDLKQLGSSCMPSYWNTVSPDGSSFASVSTGGVLSTQSLSAQNSKTLATGAVSADWSRAPAPMVAMNMTRDNNNTWSAPTLLGGNAYYISQAAVTVMPVSSVPAYNRKQAVGTSLDGTVYYRQLASTANGNTWSAWTVAPGVGGAASGFKAKHVSIAGAYDGSAQVVAIGLDDNVYHAMRYANGTWSGFNPLGLGGSNGNKARTAAIAISGSTATSPGTAQVIANDFDNGSFFHRVRYADGNWTPWALQSTLLNTGSLAITADYDGKAYILATQPENGLLRTVRYADGAWDAWTLMRRPGSATSTPIDISLAADTTYIDAQSVYVGIVDANGDMWFQVIDNPLDWNSWVSPATPPKKLLSNAASVSVNFANLYVDVTVTQPGIQAQLR